MSLRNSCLQMGHSGNKALRRLRLLLPLLLLGQFAVAQIRERQQKALYLYHFARFVEWPAQSFPTPDAPFVIGVVGPDPFDRFLETVVRREKLSGHPVQVQYYPSAEDIRSCHILYVASNRRASLLVVSGHPVLTVGDEPDFIKEGGMIQFITVRKQVRFLIRPASAKAANLTISSRLLRLAKIID